ncbi:MAG: serine/threonine-protein phosphatase [Rhodocyclaceae bacterium]|nr:serine/threonine-protein phosphatase [Rhodocyclaceae bacterium]
MKFTIFQESRIGKRRNNQDRLSYCYSRDSLLMVVADGMGGHLHGEIAAQIAVQYLTEAFQRESLPRLPDPFMFLSWGFTNAHQAITAYAAEHGLPDAPRTTCVACVVQDNIAYWAHAGDSRLYVIRDGRILAQTRDHSRVQVMIDQGLLSAEEALHHPARNRVYSCLGGDHAPQIDFSRKTPLASGDVIALCSDGVWGPLDDAAMIRTLSTTSVMQGVPRLLGEAESRAGESCDNLSLIALNWEDNYGGDTAPLVETRTMPFDAHTTQMEGFSSPRAREKDLTEDEIERAIEEIRGAIQKYSR